MRSRQRWRIIAPELLQYCDIEADEETRSLDLRVILLNPKVSWDAWGKLARPVVSSSPNLDVTPPFTPTCNSSNGRPSKKKRVTKNARKVETLSALEGLSNELLDMIIEQLEREKVDIIAIGLSSQRLWQVVLRYIHAGYLKCAAPWAGKKMAFQGTYSTDLPEVSYSAAEIYFLEFYKTKILKEELITNLLILHRDSRRTASQNQLLERTGSETCVLRGDSSGNMTSLPLPLKAKRLVGFRQFENITTTAWFLPQLCG